MILQILFGSSQGGNNFIENLINRNRPAPAPIPAPQQPQVFQVPSPVSFQSSNPLLFRRNSTIMCHQPPQQNGFRLSLTDGFNPDLFVRRNP